MSRSDRACQDHDAVDVGGLMGSVMALTSIAFMVAGEDDDDDEEEDEPDDEPDDEQKDVHEDAAAMKHRIRKQKEDRIAAKKIKKKSKMMRDRANRALGKGSQKGVMDMKGTQTQRILDAMTASSWFEDALISYRIFLCDAFSVALLKVNTVLAIATGINS